MCKILHFPNSGPGTDHFEGATCQDLHFEEQIFKFFALSQLHKSLLTENIDIRAVHRLMFIRADLTAGCLTKTLVP